MTDGSALASVGAVPPAPLPTEKEKTMAKFRVAVRPSGLINGREWPEAGEVIELPEAVGAGMSEAGTLEAVAVEKRPAATKRVETRAKKS